MTSAAITLMLSGCFFDQLQQSQERDIRRVEQKQATLQAEQARSAKLSLQEEQLSSELGERELSLAELNERVQKINADNGRTIEDNDAARQRYQNLLGQLHESNEQLNVARNALGGSVEERRAHIESLKAQLKEQVDLLFH